MAAVIEHKILDTNNAIMVLQGKIDNTTDDEINSAFDELLEKKMTNIILDFTKVHYLNSTGIATIMGIAKELSDDGKKTHIVNLNQDSRMMFEAIGLNRWVKYFSIVDDALKAFK